MAMTTVTTRPYVLASETPLLRGEKDLCPLLKTMDEEEARFLDQDLKQEETRIQVWKKGPLKNGIILGGVSVICAVISAIFFYTSRKRNEGTRENDDTTNQTRGFISGAVAFIAFIESIASPFHARKELKSKLNSDIIGERICRLKNKIRQIDRALEGNLLDSHKDQILKVKDYFNLRLSEMVIEKTNVLNIKVT